MRILTQGLHAIEMTSFDGNKCSIVADNYASVFFFLLFSLAMLDMHVVAHDRVKAVPTLFIFGDSTFDVGTNNYLSSKTKANFPYHGIDFSHSAPTGRFSNGLNTADQIARQFGYRRSPPPFLDLEKLHHSFKQNILLGVNFASGGSGILRYTGYKQSGEVVSLEKQVQQFALVRGNISEILGPKKDANFVSGALFLISVGSNDLFDYARNESGVFHLGKEENLAVLQLNYYSHIRKLYELGARKFGILSVPPIGCCPAVASANNGGNCVKPLNDFAVAFYTATQTLLQKLSSELEEFEYSLGNTYAMFTTLLKDPLAFGFNDTKSACCGIGKFNGEGPCMKVTNLCVNHDNHLFWHQFNGEGPCIKVNLCVNRDDHLFWDWFHPTERASELATKMLFAGGTEFVFPKNFSQFLRS